MADVRTALSGYGPTDRQLRYLGAALAYLVAGIHMFHPQRGLPRLAVLVASGNVGLLLSDPRPFLFVVSGLSIVTGTLLVLWGFPRKPVYLGGIVLVSVYLVGYFAWHLSGHGGFLPGREPVYHGLSPSQSVVEHLRAYPVARLSKIAEALLLADLAVLYGREG